MKNLVSPSRVLNAEESDMIHLLYAACRCSVAVLFGSRKSVAARTATHSMKAVMLIRSQTPTPGVGIFACTCEAYVAVHAPAARTRSEERRVGKERRGRRRWDG